MKNIHKDQNVTRFNILGQMIIFTTVAVLLLFIATPHAQAQLKPSGDLSELITSCSVNMSIAATSDPISALWGFIGFAGLWILRKIIGR